MLLIFSKMFCLYFQENCDFEESNRGEMFLKSRELDGKEDDETPPEPSGQILHIR